MRRRRRAGAAAPAAAPLQAPVVVYFDGKDHRTKTKIEELLRGRDIVFTGPRRHQRRGGALLGRHGRQAEEFPIVVIAGTPVGGFTS